MEMMLEKVARAICAAGGQSWREPPYNALHTDALNNHWRHKARAAIEAMRQPTQTMEYAGGIKCEEMMFGGDADYTGVIFKDMGTVWRTMADAALTEPTSAPGTE